MKYTEIKKAQNIIRRHTIQLIWLPIFILGFLFIGEIRTIDIVLSSFFFLWIFNNIHIIIKHKKLIKKYQKEIDDEKKSYGTYGDFNSLLNELFKEYLNKQRQNQRTYSYQPHTITDNNKLNNAYKLMKLTKNDSIDKIKTTYKKLAMKWHPDRWSTDSEDNKKNALRNFKKLQSAYTLIKQDKNLK